MIGTTKETVRTSIGELFQIGHRYTVKIEPREYVLNPLNYHTFISHFMTTTFQKHTLTHTTLFLPTVARQKWKR